MRVPDGPIEEFPPVECGDGLCDISEVDWCFIDCSYVPLPCGDGYCSDSETCSSCEQDCGICDTSGVINVPGYPEVAPVSEMYERAEQLGIPPSVAGVPNIEEFLQSGYPGGSVSQSSYPYPATSLQDFINKLFLGGVWQNNSPFYTPGAWASDAFGCQVRQVTERYNVRELVSFNRAADLLFPSALNQGVYINIGFGALTPLHVVSSGPSPQRKPVNLVGTFTQMATSPTATVGDIYASIGQMINTANANGKISLGTVYPEIKSAASLDEVAAKFKLDLGILGASVTPNNNNGRNTVFVLARQPLFAIFQDLGGFTPTLAQFNPSTFGVQNFYNLGDMNELGYDNLPTYVRYVTYGRMVLFSVSATSTQADLEAAANAFYTGNATGQQQNIIQNSVIQIVARAGAGPLQEAELKVHGHWQDSFNLMNVPVTSIQPIAFEVRRLDDQLATMSRTKAYTERTCPGAPILANYVGVLSGAGTCPGNIETIYIHMDNEDRNEQSNVSGWVGATNVDGSGNINYVFCRVPGAQFRSLAATNSLNSNYAVLKLDQSCPEGSVEFSRHFDNEDSYNANSYSGNIFPNVVDGNSTLSFCLFKGDGSIAPSFPNLGFEYGVFAASQFSFTSARGSIYSDDEDRRNANWYSADPAWKWAATAIISEGSDTTLNTARAVP
jgi:hypothetical protein